jgi:ribosome biogenesis protein BRX1
VPKGHPRAKPFVDHIMSFHALDGRIWVRHYQIVPPDASHAAQAAAGERTAADGTPDPLAAGADPVEEQRQRDRHHAAAVAAAGAGVTLVEVGPRMVLQVVKVFTGAFQGGTLYKNGSFETPSAMRRYAKLAKADRYSRRIESQESRVAREKDRVVPEDELADVFAAPGQESESDDDGDGEGASGEGDGSESD